MVVRVQLPTAVQQALWQHLIGDQDAAEEVAFVFAKTSGTESDQTFDYVEWFAVPPSGFAWRSKWHLELSDETRAQVIKRAHDLGASIVEFHSHRGPWPAQFSGSDWVGFEEFVPHVLWRLKGKPYVAVVVADTGFDGLAWTNGASAMRLTHLRVGESVLEPSGMSPLTRGAYGMPDE